MKGEREQQRKTEYYWYFNCKNSEVETKCSEKAENAINELYKWGKQQQLLLLNFMARKFIYISIRVEKLIAMRARKTLKRCFF